MISLYDLRLNSYNSLLRVGCNTSMQTSRTVLKDKIDPKDIAKEFVIGELIKMFPQVADEEFYDRIRFFVRETMDTYSENRFWNLIAGLSETFMVKSLHRMLRGTQYSWSLEEVPMHQLKVKSFASGALGDIMKKVNYNAEKGGAILRSMSPDERIKILHPFRMEKDTYPVIALEEGDDIILHDGNRRTLNLAVYGIPTVRAYVGRPNKKGKPAIDEAFLAMLLKVMSDGKDMDADAIKSTITILLRAKKNYSNGEPLVKQYVCEHLYPYVKDTEFQHLVEKAFPYVIEKKKHYQDGNKALQSSHRLYLRKYSSSKKDFFEAIK